MLVHKHYFFLQILAKTAEPI